VIDTITAVLPDDLTMTTFHPWISLILLGTFVPTAVLAAEMDDAWPKTAELAAPEAHQASAADERFVYAITSRQVAKYDRATGRRIAISTGAAQHLNSGFLWKGKLLCAHSNYPKTPERSEIKVLDPGSMKLSTFKDFGNFGGSLTWVLRRDGYWWCNFARYGDKNAETFFVQFDDDWKELRRWTYPRALISQLGRYSLSGGLWYRQELLVTGHDKPEVYRMRLPGTGTILEYVGKQPVPFTGQGFAKDLATGGLVGINRARRLVVFAGIISPAAPITHGPFVGHLADNRVSVWAKASRPGRYRLSADSLEGHRVTAEADSRSEHDGCLLWKLQSLRPGTRYHYEITLEDKRLVTGDDYFFETTGSKRPAPVRLVFGSCAREDEGSSAVWRQMRVADPHAVVLLGDTPYIDSTELAVQRRRYSEFSAVGEFRKLLRSRSLYGTWDDHDFGRNDTDGNLEGKQTSRRVFMEYRPNPSFGNGSEGIYTSFRRDGVEVFLLDTRFFAGTEPSPFDKNRPSLLGKEQWKWLHRELKASTAPFKVLACGMIWNGAVRPGKRDHWATYPHERQALFEFIGKEKIGGVILVGGDVHRTRFLRHRTGDSAGYQIPELITSPIHDGVIETANAPHPALVHDSGQPNSFLLMTVHGHAQPPTLKARFLDKNGRTVFGVTFSEPELKTASDP